MGSQSFSTTFGFITRCQGLSDSRPESATVGGGRGVSSMYQPQREQCGLGAAG